MPDKTTEIVEDHHRFTAAYRQAIGRIVEAMEHQGTREDFTGTSR